MNKINKNKVLAVLFLLIIGFFSILPSAEVGMKVLGKFSKKVSAVEVTKTNTNNLNAESEPTDNKKNNNKTISKKLKNTIRKIDNIYNENIFQKSSFIEINGYFQKLMGKNVIDNGDGTRVIKDNNNYLHYGLMVNPINVSNQAKNISNLNDFCKNEDIKFMYVQAPFKVNGEEGQLPIGVNDYSNNAADDLLQKLKDKNVEYLDLRESIKEDSLTYEDIFFKTDHHWTLDSAFWAYNKITDKLSSTYDLEFDDKYINVNNYNSILLKKSFVGSQGIRVGKYYTDIDDVKYYTPKFDTNLTYSLFRPNGDLVMKNTGDFSNSIIDQDRMQSDDVYTSKYDAFLRTNNEIHIVNNNADNDKKILFIKDSFARPVASYMSLNYKETRLLDLRNYKGSTYEYIKEYNPDVVIMLYNARMLKNKFMFNFNN